MLNWLLKSQLHSAYMVRVCVGCVVQNDRLGEIPPEDAEIFDVVAEDTGTVVLIQTMSGGKSSTCYKHLHLSLGTKCASKFCINVDVCSCNAMM